VEAVTSICRSASLTKPVAVRGRHRSLPSSPHTLASVAPPALAISLGIRGYRHRRSGGRVACRLCPFGVVATMSIGSGASVLWMLVCRSVMPPPTDAEDPDLCHAEPASEMAAQSGYHGSSRSSMWGAPVCTKDSDDESPCILCTATDAGGLSRQCRRSLRNEKVRGSSPLSSTRESRWRSPERAPHVHLQVEPLQTGRIGDRPEVVQIAIRGADRGVTRPG
jgi:hypothetical protein